MSALKLAIQNLLPEIIKIRHDIHAHPELAHRETRTATVIAATLKQYGYEVTEGIAGTGVCAILDSGKPGKTVALRADIDALPITEQTSLDYASQTQGIMHACGHDGHTATLLAAAGALKNCTDQFRGKIKFIFQPAEETGTGAASLIQAGILENPRVDAIFGYHNTSKTKAGFFRTRVGCIHAAQDVFTVVIHGKGGHGAQPQLTIDPIFIGASIVQALQSIVSRFTTPTEAVVVSVTQFHAGTTHNAISDTATLNGTIRTVTPEIRQQVKQRFADIITGIAHTFGATVDIDFSYSFPPTINHPTETELTILTAQQVLGTEKVLPLPDPGMPSEDFSYYLEKVPGCFFWIGTGLEHLRPHSVTYEFNDAIIPAAAQVMAQVAINYLNT